MGPGPLPTDPVPTAAEPPATAGGSSVSAPVPLVGLAHGSRHPGAVASLDRLLAAVTAASGVPAVPAFLDLAEPDLADAASGLARSGHQAAVVVPLLFTEAFHATVDVPEAVAAAAERSGLDLVVADIIGTSDDVADTVARAAARAGIADTDAAVLFAVGSSRAEANAAVDDLAGRLAAVRSGPVRAGFGTCQPRGRTVAAELADTGAPVAVVPLFVSPGLLLDPLVELAAGRGWTVVPPLEAALAPVVLARYRSALAARTRSPRTDAPAPVA